MVVSVYQKAYVLAAEYTSCLLLDGIVCEGAPSMLKPLETEYPLIFRFLKDCFWMRFLVKETLGLVYQSKCSKYSNFVIELV